MNELQHLVDDVAQRLDAPAVLEDRAQRMVVYSSHDDPIDDIRRDSILRRTTPPPVVAWFREFGIAEATEPVRIPSHPDLGILGRLCVPVRFRDQLVGFLWLIDDDGHLGPEQVAEVVSAARTAAVLMYGDELTSRLASDLLRNLLSPSEELRTSVARELVDLGGFPTRRSSAVVVVQACDEAGHPVEVGPAIAEALWELSRESVAEGALRLANDDHGVLLVPDPDGDRSRKLATAACAAVQGRVARGDGDGGDIRVVAGVGEPQERLAAAFSSYRQARLAANTAAVLPSLGDVAEWARLGVFRALALLPPDDALDSALDPRLRPLLDEANRELASTVEAWLDLAGDVQRTAAKLHMHRATLYYRLKRVEELCGVDLKSGDDRLAVHLGLKLVRLTGTHRA
jgi:sugar diacid utilization regulator